MPTLLLLRHAKAVPPESFPGVDVDRPLANRGRADAKAAGGWLAGHRFRPDLVVCSTALRTRQTWEHAVGGGATAADIWFDRRIYDADLDDLFEVVREVPPEASTVLLIGHAPGLPWLAAELAGEVRSSARDRMEQKYPTSALALLEATVEWADIGPGDAKLVDFAVPRG